MNKKTINSKKHSKIFIFFILFNLFLGVLLSFFLITNVEWNSIFANIIFPIIAFIIAKKSCSYSKRKFEKNERRKISLACIPSFFISILYFIYYLFFLTIGLLSLMFSISEEQNKIKIQSVHSPNKNYYCEVFFSPVGAYASGTGKLNVYCINTYFPLVRKHIYVENPSYFPIDDVNLPYEFIQWKNNKIICIAKEAEIDVSKIEVYLYIIIKKYFLKSQQQTYIPPQIKADGRINRQILGTVSGKEFVTERNNLMNVSNPLVSKGTNTISISEMAKQQVAKQIVVFTGINYLNYQKIQI